MCFVFVDRGYFRLVFGPVRGLAGIMRITVLMKFHDNASMYNFIFPQAQSKKSLHCVSSVLNNIQSWSFRETLGLTLF